MNTLFKKSLMATALVLMSAGAMAASSTSGTFEWHGTYNMTTPSTDFCINVSDALGDGIAHNAGELTFTASGADASKLDITSASELGFKVVARDSDGKCNGDAIPFAYTLTDYKVGIIKDDGFEVPVSDSTELARWKLTHKQYATGSSSVVSYDQLAMDEAQKMAAGGDVSLKVKGLYLSNIEDGDAVRVRAFVLIDASAGAAS